MNSLVLEKVFDFIGRDVLKAVLICKSWKLILNDRRYWKRIVLHIHMENVNEVMSNTDRLNLVGEIQILHLDSMIMARMFRLFAADNGNLVYGKTLNCIGFCNDYYNTVLYCIEY